MLQHLASWRILCMNVVAHAIPCRASSLLPYGFSGANLAASQGHRLDLLQDIAEKGHFMLTNGAHIL